MKSTRFSIAATVSVALHVALASTLVLGYRLNRASPPMSVLPPESIDAQRPTEPSGAEVVPVELEGMSQQLSALDATRAKQGDAFRPTPESQPPTNPARASVNSNEEERREAWLVEKHRNRNRSSAQRDTSSSERTARVGDSASPQRAPSVIAHDAVTQSTARPVTQDGLREAMQAAAASSGSNAVASAVPIVRVDPREKNLDRAWSRAFAWAFATDRSFFTLTPVGRARFVLQLNEAGAIADVYWSEPKPSSRIRELVLRMVRLLSQNRFSVANPDGESPPRRGYEMMVTESRVEVPKQSAADSQAGDLWMLGAGETPTLSQPSHPTVVDVTGHKLSCVLRILEPLPNVK